jgi:serine protease Do
MKKIFLIPFLLIMSLNAANIEFKEAPKNPDRILPQDNDEILSFAPILKNGIDAVVNISTRTNVKMGNRPNIFNDPFFEQFFRRNYQGRVPQDRTQRALGSGVIITEDGYIVTNHHVIDGADEISVTLSGSDEEHKAKLIGSDKDSDIALIKIDAKDLHPIAFANAKDIKIGDVVFAIGNPFGVGESVTQGIVSALGKDAVGINRYENFIQTDASINPGNSGGALIDSRGALIGINTAILSRSGGNHGIGFAIPADMVKNVITQLAKNGKVSRGYMGINISHLTNKLRDIYKNKKGVIVTNVQEGSAADKAGIKRGDLIIDIDKKSIQSPQELSRIIGEKNPNETIQIKLERDRDIQFVTLKLDDQKDALSFGNTSKIIEGAQLADITPQIAQDFRLTENSKGVAIIAINPNSQAEKEGFQVGDVIIQVENSPIGSIEHLHRYFENSSKGAKRVYINRRGMIILLVLR